MATLPIRVGWFTRPLGSNRAYPNDLRTWAQRNNVLLSTTALTQPQIGSSIDTDLPPRQRAYPSSLRTFTQNVDIWLIGQDALLPQRNRYDTSLPIARPYPVSLRTWTQNLQQRTALQVLVLNGDVGTYSITGSAAQFAGVLPDEAGSYSVTGSAAALLEGYVLSGAIGSYSITGLDAGLISSVLPTLATRAASFVNQLGSRVAYPNSLRTWTQNLQQTTLAPRALALSGDIGSYSVTGFDAALFEGHVLSDAIGSYSITGLDAGLISSTVPTLATRSASFVNQLGSRGAYPNALRTWTQRNTTLLGTTAVTPQQIRERIQTDLSGRQKTYPNDLRTWSQRNTVLLSTTALTSQQIRNRIQTDLPGRQIAYPNSLRTWTQNLRETTLASQNKILTSDIGTYNLTGFDAQFAEAVPGVIGTYSITGSAAGLIEGHVLSGAVGTYSVTGSAAQFVTAVHVLPGAVGSYSVTGLATNLIFSGAVVVPPVVIPPGGGGVWGAVGGTSRQPRDRRRLKVAARSGAYSLSGRPADFVVVRHYRLRIEKVKRKNYQIFSGYPNSRRTYVMPRPQGPFIVTLNGAPANGKCNSFETIMRAMDRKRVIDNNNIFLLAA